MRCVFYTISFHLNFSLLMFLLWDSKGWQFRNNFLSKYSVPYDTIYNMQKISFEKNVYIYIWMILERAERGGECGMFNIPDAFFGHIFLSLHLFFISQSWNFIIDDMTLFQSYYYMYVHTHAYNVLGQIMHFKSIGIITTHKFSNFILNTWSLICLNLPILSHKKMEKKLQFWGL